MNRYQPLYEMAIPSSIHKAKTYYHGTPYESKGLSIIKNGIHPPDLKRRRGLLTPVKGKVYLTSSLRYACIYVLGGDMLGSDVSGFLKGTGEDYKVGYLFVIDGNSLVDIQPDEDSIGEMLYYAVNKKQSKEYTIKDLDWLIRLAGEYLDQKLYNRVKRYDDYAYFADAGKRLVNQMHDYEKLELIDKGAHIAHGGIIIPSQAWKFDKSKSTELKQDGSNFFNVAEKVK